MLFSLPLDLMDAAELTPLERLAKTEDQRMQSPGADGIEAEQVGLLIADQAELINEFNPVRGTRMEQDRHRVSGQLLGDFQCFGIAGVDNDRLDSADVQDLCREAQATCGRS